MTILQKTCKYTGKNVWAVEYIEARPKYPARTMRTSWTTHEKEAEAWQEITLRQGYCISARPLPV